MKTERAIELLNRISDSQFDGEHGDERREALSMAVRALFSQQIVNDSQGLVNDCISRKMAIDQLHQSYNLLDAEQRLEDLPSAQQQRILYANMSDAEFEKWLYEHGICNPNIHESIPCDAVPLLIDNAISELPSAQPEIIRCTECKHYREYDSKYVENAVVVQCMADRYPISEIIPDGWFCAGAERKDDE